MRREFWPILLDKMHKDERIIVLTADLGFGMFDKIREEFESQKRFVNCGSSEQLMLGMGVGAAIEGKIPICYSISSFLLRRPYEWIHLYLNIEQIPVKLLGGGRNKDYAHDGPSHFATDDRKIMSNFPNIQTYWPENVSQMKDDFNEYLYNGSPSYLNLIR
jgi:transketolase